MFDSIFVDRDYTTAPDIIYHMPMYEGDRYAVKKFERSPSWDKIRDIFVVKHPYCKICNGKKQLQVHHVRPFHLYPELELSQDNLRVLCVACHLTWGHLGDWKSFNIDLDKDIEKILNRPYSRI